LSFRASPDFWSLLHELPRDIQELARRNFELLKENPRHPSLHFKKAGRYWSARVGLNYRVVGVESKSGILWFWIGPHDEYEDMLR
jgi:hypothetical protein